MEPEIAPRSQRYWDLALAFRLPEAGAPSDLSLAFTRLFLGPGRPIAHPYESVYVEGRLAGEAAAQVERSYAEAGLQMSAAGRELPDHVSLELAFMGCLAAQEERDPELRAVWRDRQRRFLHEHLARWLPKFCEKIESSETHPYYNDAARAAKELIGEDVARLSYPLADAESRLSTRSQDSEHAPSQRSRDHPNIRLGVNSSLCTLCTLCADNCQPDALTVVCTPTALELAFDPARCNGCRACLRLCPEGAIIINRGPAPGVDAGAPRSVVAAASRAVCPECHHPHVAEPWLERLAERLGGGESIPASGMQAIRRSLALCPLCKADLGDGFPIPVGLQHRMFASA